MYLSIERETFYTYGHDQVILIRLFFSLKSTKTEDKLVGTEKESLKINDLNLHL